MGRLYQFMYCKHFSSCLIKTVIKFLSNLISNFMPGFRKMLSNSSTEPKIGVAYKKCVFENEKLEELGNKKKYYNKNSDKKTVGYLGKVRSWYSRWTSKWFCLLKGIGNYRFWYWWCALQCFGYRGCLLLCLFKAMLKIKRINKI